MVKASKNTRCSICSVNTSRHEHEEAGFLDLICLTPLVPWCRSLRASGMFLFKWWPHTSWSKSNNQGHYQYKGRKEESESRHPLLDLEDWESEVGKLSSLVCPSDDNNWQELLHWGIWQTISMSRCSCSTERAQTQEQKHMPAQYLHGGYDSAAACLHRVSSEWSRWICWGRQYVRKPTDLMLSPKIDLTSFVQRP